MDLFQNPFLILGACTRDNRHRISELAEERSLLFDPNTCMDARSDLTNPRKRLSAEVAWLPGIAPKRVEELMSLLESSPEDLLRLEKLPSISKTNLIATALGRLSDLNTEILADWITVISLGFECIDPEDMRGIINEERIVSGFPEVSDLQSVEFEIQERRIFFCEVIKSALDKMSPKDLVKTITNAVELLTDEGEEQGPILIDDIVDSYEIEAQEFLDKEERNIKSIVEKLRAVVDEKRPDTISAPLVSQLIQVVKNWDFVAQPIQVSAKSRGLDHEASHRVARLVRELAVYIFNEHGKLDFSQQLTSMLQEVFAEVGDVAERTSEDGKTLNNIAEQRARLIEEAKDREEKWREEITYEAEIGALFKDKLCISPEGIFWKGHHWNLDSITGVRWGGTRNYVNGISTGTVYSIFISDGDISDSIDTRKEGIYLNFIDRLWKSVGVRLLTEYLEGLRNGKTYRFGSAILSDHGMELERKRLFSSNEKCFCTWSELEISNGPGVFCISKKKDSKFTVSLSYLNEDNIHILEAAITLSRKQCGVRLSSLLGN